VGQVRDLEDPPLNNLTRLETWPRIRPGIVEPKDGEGGEVKVEG